MMCDKRKAVLYCRVGPGKRETPAELQLQREILRKTAHQRGLSVVSEVLACETGGPAGPARCALSRWPRQASSW